jgi:uncharacterized membrane protein YqiK
MSTNTALILSGSGYELAIAPEAEAQKAELLKHSALITEVRDASASDAARNQIKKLAAMRNLVEASRKQVKEPVLKIGKDIDSKAADFVAEIVAEEKRLTGHVGEFAAEVERERQRVLREMEEKRRAEEKARQEAEAARLKAEQEAAHAAFLAEQARKAAEAKEWEEDEAQAAKAREEAATAEAAAKAAQAEQDRIAAAAAAAAAPAVPVFVPQAVAGTKMVPDFEVLNIDALYAYSASLVTMEPKRSEILALIKSLTKDGNLPEIPGLRVFEKPVVSTR